jgi:hypothetical protein
MTAFDFLLYAIVAFIIAPCFLIGVFFFWGMIRYTKAELKKREINMKKMENNVWN